jgi:diguanylate cyclase (GGDEF)-like protein
LQALCTPPAWASATRVTLTGTPPYETFTPDLDVFPQNFGIVQDAQGIVYVGNYEGLLEYDGERWYLTRLPNGDLVRSLAVDARGRLYVGGYNTFGYFTREATGRLAYTDLAPRFAGFMKDREIADVWEVRVTAEGIYFRSTQDVFFWDPGSGQPQHWRSDSRFGATAHVGGKTYLQFREQGIRVREGEDWRLLPGTEALREVLYGLIPLGDGSLLGFGRDGRWWRVDERGARLQKMPAGMPASSHFSSGLRLPDGGLAFSSKDGAVTLVSPDLATKREIKLDVSYLPGMAPAQGGGFLVVGQQSFHHMQWPSVWTVLRSEEGADGDINKVADWHGRRYLLTSSGARVARMTATGVRFEKTGWGNGAYYDLIGLSPTRALLAEAHRLKLLENGRLTDVRKDLIYPRSFQRSRFRPARIFLCTEAGLRVIETANGTLRISERHPDNANLRLFALVEISATELWASTERHGVLRYTLDAQGEVARVDSFGTEHGLRFGKIADTSIARMPNGDLVVGTHEGLFRFDGRRFVADTLGGLDRMRGPNELLAVVPLPDGQLWAYGPTRLHHRERDGRWHSHAIRALRRGAIVDHLRGDDGRMVFVASNSLLIHHGSDHGAAARVQPLWRRVTRIDSDGTATDLPLAVAGSVNEKVRLAKGDYSIRFEFALPEMVRAGVKSYQGRMTPIEESFSEWGPEAKYTYSDLQARNFKLEIRARDSRGVESALPPLEFQIVPPWYQRTQAKLAYAVLAALMMLGLSVAVARARTARMAATNRELERKVEERTRELHDAIRRLDMMAHVDGLTGIANRRRLDEYLPAIWNTCAGNHRSVSMLAVDVDHFKDYNDRHGHVAGDEILKVLSRELLSCLRRSEDLLARYGGEEFVIVMPGAEALVAVAFAESIRAHVESLPKGITVSVGVATMMPDAKNSHEQLLARADEALYAAKRSGRNQVSVYGLA